MSESFKDHFSKQAGDYARFRPTYPDALFAWVASVAPARERAWDCATGNGQAALGLAPHFAAVVATDASERQLANAVTHERIRYRVAPAEDSGIEDASIDAITVAQAVHWFDFERFYAEVRRVLRPGGVVVLWTYQVCLIAPEIDRALAAFYADVVGPYWPPERRWVEEEYRTLPFPFEDLEAPAFSMLNELAIDDVVGYLGTWSATQAFRRKRGFDPVAPLREELLRVWPDPDRRRPARWPLHLRAGRVP